MITHRPANTRGFLQQSWIQTRRTFSNNSYWDPKYMNYSDLEVINDDILEPGGLVPNHEHKNMEILGYIVSGPATHTDSLGNTQDVPAGAVQFMSSGKSIWHTEGNNTDRPIRYLQLWIKPAVENTEPHWEYQTFDRTPNTLIHIAGTNGIKLKQDAEVYAGIFTEPFDYAANRKCYVYIVQGTGTLNGIEYGEGDGFAIDQELVTGIPTSTSELIVFDLR